MWESLTVARLWEICNTKFSLMGVVCFMILCFVALRLIKKSIGIINFIAQLPSPLLAGGFTTLAAGGFGYSVMDIFAKTPTFSGQTNGFVMCASITLSLVALKYEKQNSKEC
jgi:hypothetical protein